MKPPLVVSKDPQMMETVLACAAAAGSSPLVTRDLAQIRAVWQAASRVIVGTDSAAWLAGIALPGRDEIYLCGNSSAELIRWSVPLNARVIELPGQQGVLTALLGEGMAWHDSAPVIQVIGGSGGVGASTLAAGLAVSAARQGIRPVLVEADPFGGGLDLLFSAEDEPGWRWADLKAARGHIDDLGPSLPQVCGVDLLAVGRLAAGEAETAPIPEPAALSAVFASLGRSHDLVVVDGGYQMAAQLAAEVVLVAAAEVKAVMAARCRLVQQQLNPTGVVVRCGLGKRLDPELVGETLGVPLLGVIGEERQIRSGAERGEPPGRRGRYARVCDQILTQVL